MAWGSATRLLLLFVSCIFYGSLAGRRGGKMGTSGAFSMAGVFIVCLVLISAVLILIIVTYI